MINTAIKSWALVLQVSLLAAIVGIAYTAGAEKGRSIIVRFPAFSLTSGERISGMKLKTSRGRIHVGFRPNRWTCDQSDDSVHCYSLHSTYALGISGMLPEMIITHLPDDEGRPSLEASVEFVDNNGKEYSRDIRGDEMIVK